MTKEQYSGTQWADRAVLDHRALDERQEMARRIRGMLVRFQREWDEVRERESGSSRVLASNAMLDRYSHQIFSTACDAGAILGDDLARELRSLSAEIIKTANVLMMIGCGEECREENEALTKEALLRMDRCMDLVRTKKGYPATRITPTHRQE